MSSELVEQVEDVPGEVVELTPEQAARLAALEQIDRVAQDWKTALVNAEAVGCSDDAIRNRVIGLISDVFGVPESMMQALTGMIGG